MNILSNFSRGVLRFAAVMMIGFTIAAATMHGQTENASLSGVVLDPTGARIPDATIELRSNKTHDVRKTVSNGDGVYNFIAVPPTTYTMVIKRQGFETTRVVDISLHPADARELEVTMKIGKVETEVVVNDTDEPPNGGQRSSLISAEDINHLSVQGRDVSELVKNEAGFAIVPPNGLTNGTYDPGQVGVGGGLSNFVANGASTGISVVADGADITDPNSGNSTTQNINQEMVQEVKIDTSAFGAAQSKGPIVLNVVTKSGGFNYHGGVYVYARTHQLNSQNWFSKNQGLMDAPDRYLYPGANFGGPVRLPIKNFNRSKRLTFFVGAEDYVQRNVYAYGSALSSSVLALVPTANMRLGNFSQAELANYLGTDPATLAAQCTTTGALSSYVHLCGSPTGVTNNGTAVPASGIIPTGGLDPGGAAILTSLPLPNRPTAGGFNYLTTNFQNADLWQLKTRLDDAVSDKLKLSLSYGSERGRTTAIPEAQSYSPANGGPDLGGVNTPGKGVARVFTQSLSFTTTYIFNPSLTNEGYVSAALNRNDFGPLHPELLQASLYGYPYQGIYPNATTQMPQLLDYGYDGTPVGLYPDFTYWNFFQHTFTPTFGDTLSKSWRSHTIQTGVYLQRTISNNSAPNPATNGQILNYYLPNGTNLPTPDGSAGSGGNTLAAATGTGGYPVCSTTPVTTPPSCISSANYLADLAIGDVQQFYQQNFETNLDLYYWNTSLFASDSWKATRKITFTFGLRVEHLGPWQDGHGNGIAVFSPSIYNSPVSQLLPGFSWHGIDPSIPNAGADSRLFFYSPRAGVAYDATGDGKTIFRGGFGFYRSHDPGGIYSQAAGTAQGMFTSTAGGSGIQLSKLTHTSSSLADCVNRTIANGSSKCPSLNAFVYGVDRKDDEEPLTYTYNFSMTQRLWNNAHLDLAYVGSQAQNLLLDTSLQNVDALPVGALFVKDPITHTFSLPNSLSIAQQGDYRPYRPFQGVYVGRHLSYTNYNALQAAYSKRSGKLRYNVNFTWSKNLGLHTLPGQPSDPTNLRNNYGYMPADRTYIANATYSYEFGQVVHGNRLLSGFANGWEISGITNLQSGPNLPSIYSTNFKIKGTVGPYSVNQATWLGTPDISLQPSLVCDPSANLKSKQYVNGDCFKLPAVGSNGDFRFPYLHGPAYFTSDITLVKNFKLRGERALQFRFAGFNFLNHPITSFSGRFPQEANLYFTGNAPVSAALSSPNTNCSVTGSSCFGYAGYKQGRRVLEVAAKYVF